MSITFSGLGSGLDYSSWIDQLVEIKMQSVTKLQTQQATLESKQSTLNSVKSTFNTLRSSLETISDSKYGGSMDIFAANTTESSDSKYVTATVTNSAARQDLSIYVKQLASNTVATSTKTPGKEITGDTIYSNLANGNARTGTFSIYVDNQRHQIEVDSDDTLDDVMEKINSIDGVSASISDSKMTISSDKSLSLGSNSDTSNFTTVLGLTTYDADTKSYTSNHQVTELKDSAKILAENSGFASSLVGGTFTIGNATFTVDEDTTLKSLVSDINSNSEAGVKATFDYTSGKLLLTSSSTGSMNINIEAGTSNITDIFGLTENGKLVEGSQVTGKNAELTINGTDVVSFSNTVTSEVTGLSGVTLNLYAANSPDDENTIVSVKQNTDKIYNQISQMVKDLNSVISQIDSNTATDEDSAGILAYETQLTGMRNSLRTMVMRGQNLSDGSYTSLAAIGITTGAVGTSVSEDTNQLVIDEDKLKEALNNNPELVKELLIGTDSSGSSGVINDMLNLVSNSLNSESGYFATKSNSISNQISLLDDKIEKKTEQAETYRSNLETQFQAMDTAISKLQEQYSGIDFDSL